VTESAAELALPPSQVEELMQLLGKALRAHQLYLPNNPVYQKAMENLRVAFAHLWESTDDLVLDVGEGELRWEGTVVYSSGSRSESIAWVLFKDGVRSVTLRPGVEQEEIVKLCEVLHRARALQAEDNDDLLTLLWEKDFQHLQYQFQEMVGEGGGGPAIPSQHDLQAGGRPALFVQQGITEEVDEGGEEGEEGEGEPGEGGDTATATARRAGIVKASDFNTTLYFLDEKEIGWIKSAVDEEYAQDLRRNVLAMLFDVMELQTYATVRTELISIVESFLPYLLGAADFGAVGYVLRESRATLERARELLPEHRQALEKLPARLSEEQALSQLLQSLDEAAALPSQDELGELFRELRGDALPTLFGWLPKLNNARVREVIESAVQRLAAANAPMVVQVIQGRDANAVVAAIRVAGRLKLAPTVGALGQGLAHAEPVVRVAAVQALAEIASPAALQALEKGLDDADREVRLASVRVIGLHKSRNALPKITAVVQGKSVRERDLTEKMAFFEAYGLMVGEPGVEALDAILNAAGGFLKRKEDPETRACAAMALGRIGSEAAKASLLRASQDKEAIVRNAVNRAIRGDRMSTMMRAGEIPT
jgi:HEAT repeat protein